MKTETIPAGEPGGYERAKEGRAMTLRERIADIVARQACGVLGGVPARPEMATDAILNMIREAMLSQPSLAALTRRLVEVGNERAGLDDDVWPDDYNDMQVVGMMGESEAGMIAALDAAGIGETS